MFKCHRFFFVFLHIICKLKLIRSEKALHDLQKENCSNIIEAEIQHSDLIPAKYEGRLFNFT